MVHHPVGQARVELQLRGGDALPVLGGAFVHGSEGGAARLGRGHAFTVRVHGQCRKCLSPVNTMATPSSSALAMFRSSRIPPPGWTMTATPAAAAASMPSGNG